MQRLEDGAAIGALAGLLSWEGGEALIRTICGNHICWLFERLVALGYVGDVNLLARVRALPVHHQQRLMLAPIVHHLLEKSLTVESWARIDRFIELEEQLSRGGRDISGWTALGDVYFSDAARQLEDEFRAPRSGHLVVDTSCPHNAILIPSDIANPKPHAHEEVARTVPRITEALDRVCRTSPIAAMLIRESSHVLRLDRTDTQPGLAASHSHRHIIGRVGFINTHRERRWTVQKFMNDLIHESIHALVYKLELVHPLYCDYRAASELKGVSPWTGRELGLHSFVHACFVWYGLCNFWARAGHVESGREFSERARNGFRQGNPLDHLSPASRDNVRVEVQELITEISCRVSRNQYA